jgi:hypothetical protein
MHLYYYFKNKHLLSFAVFFALFSMFPTHCMDQVTLPSPHDCVTQMIRFKTNQSAKVDNFSNLTPDFKGLLESNSMAVRSELTRLLPDRLSEFDKLYSFGMGLFESQKLTVAHYTFIHYAYALFLSKDSYENPRQDSGGGRPSIEYELSLFIKEPEGFSKLVDCLRERHKIDSIESLVKSIGWAPDANKGIKEFVLGSVSFTLSSFLMLPIVTRTGILPVDDMLLCTRHGILPIGVPLAGRGSYDGNPECESFQVARHDEGHGGDYGCIQGLFHSFPLTVGDPYFQGKQDRTNKLSAQLTKFTPFFNEFYDIADSISDASTKRTSKDALWVISHEFSGVRQEAADQSSSLAEFLTQITAAYERDFVTAVYEQNFVQGFTPKCVKALMAPVLLSETYAKWDDQTLRDQCLSVFKRGVGAIQTIVKTG